MAISEFNFTEDSNISVIHSYNLLSTEDSDSSRMLHMTYLMKIAISSIYQSSTGDTPFEFNFV